jgi:hypothetical protein
VTSSQPSGDTAADRTLAVEYTEGVRGEIRQLGAYFAKKITWYRIARIAVIVSAALVPVLAAVTVVPRWVLGIFGALAVATEGIQQLYQFQKSALHAMSTANSLERVLNKYITAVGRYKGSADQAFPLFVEDIETIRSGADKEFLQTWQASAPSSTAQTSLRQITPPDQLGGEPAHSE